MNRRPRPIPDALFVALCVVLCAPCASADSAIDQVAVFDPTIHFSDNAAMTLAPLLQTRWTATETGGEKPDTVAGFSVPRARLITTTSLFEAVSVRLRIGSSSNGSASFEEAYSEVRWLDFRFRVGQLPLRLNAGEEPTVQGLSPADYSSYANAFAGGRTQGAEFAYRGPVRFFATVGNGARSGFSELLSPLVADIATTGRFEVPIGPQGLGDYDSQASFRQNQPVNARIGVTGHYQARGRHTGPAYDMDLLGGELGIRGSGFALFASGTYFQIAPAGETTVKLAGMLVFGSLLLARGVETFAQFDGTWPIGDHAPFPPGVANGQPGTTMFRTITIGSNFFILPDVNRLKVQMDVQAMLDPQDTSIIPPNAALGVLNATGPQVAGRVQLVIAL